jgi:hypothetical protein
MSTTQGFSSTAGPTNFSFTLSWDCFWGQSKFPSCFIFCPDRSILCLDITAARQHGSFQDYVSDYTDLRCRRYKHCWYVWVGTHLDPTPHFCGAGGYFFHGKDRKVFGEFSGIYPKEKASLLDAPFVNEYRHNCPLSNEKDVFEPWMASYSD